MTRKGRPALAFIAFALLFGALAALACGDDVGASSIVVDGGGPDGAASEGGGAADGATDGAAPPSRPPFDAGFDLSRQCARDGELWEVCYDGVGLPGQGLAPHLAWDNPIDDDWALPEFRSTEVRIDQADGETRFFRANRTAANEPAWFFFRDPELDRESGIEISLRVRILPSSGPRAVFLGYIDAVDQFAIQLEPTSIAFSPEANQRTNRNPPGRVVVPLTLSTFRNFSIRKHPGTSTVEVRERMGDGSAQEIFSTTLTAGPAPAAPPPFTRLTFGDNEDTTNGAYDLAHLRFRRALRPAGTWPAAIADAPSVPEPSEAHFLSAIGVAETQCAGGAFTTFAALASAADFGATCRLYQRPAGTTPEDRSVCLAGATLGTGGTLASGTLRGFDARLDASQGSTIEVRYRTPADFGLVDPAERFEIAGVETRSTFGLSIGPSDLVPRAYAKPVSQRGAVFPPYAAPGAWNTLRIVRPRASIYADIYLNGVRVVRSMKMGHTEQPGTIRLGTGLGRVPLDASPVWNAAEPLTAMGWSAASRVEVDCVRWSSEAFAPPNAVP